MDCWTHGVRDQNRTGATHALGVMGAQVGIIEEDYGKRRDPPTNSGESAEGNGHISELGASLRPPSQPV